MMYCDKGCSTTHKTARVTTRAAVLPMLTPIAANSSCTFSRAYLYELAHFIRLSTSPWELWIPKTASIMEILSLVALQAAQVYT